MAPKKKLPADLPLARPTSTQSYVDKAGVERWTENDIVVSQNNGFRRGYGEAFHYADIAESVHRSARASAAVDRQRRAGVDPGTIGGLSEKTEATVQREHPQRWAAR